MTSEAQRPSDVAIAIDATFDPWPADADVHVEWGVPAALLAARRGDLVVVVDVLSFSTSVTEVIERNGIAFCYSPEELDRAGGRELVAREHDATVLSKQRQVEPGELSLSPASLQSVTPGQRVIMTSLNGGRCVAAANGAPWVAVGCLTNRTAVARRIEAQLAHGVATRCTIVPCAEIWSSPFMASQTGDLPHEAAANIRPSFEDLLGSGSIVAALNSRLRRSVEAAAAAAVFDSQADQLGTALRGCVSGRELVERGFGDDVDIAARIDTNTRVPERANDDPPNLFCNNQD